MIEAGLENVLYLLALLAMGVVAFVLYGIVLAVREALEIVTAAAPVSARRLPQLAAALGRRLPLQVEPRTAGFLLGQGQEAREEPDLLS